MVTSPFGPAATVNAALVVFAVLTLAVMERVTGRVEVNAGRGWDGVDYAAMVEGPLVRGSRNAALRPLIIFANRPAFAWTGDIIEAFRRMNYVYAALFGLALCLLLDRYTDDQAVKAVVVGNILLSIAATKFVAFMPVSLEAGALAAVTLAFVAVLAGPPWLAGLATVAAVLSREFGAVVLVFGVMRAIRTRAQPWVTAGTYLPAVAVLLGYRAYVARAWAGEPVITLEVMLGNLAFWRDPMFAALFGYFLLTVAGGVSLFVFARTRPALALLRREPEWAAAGLLVAAAAAMGDADIWRYLAYGIPLIAVLAVACASSLTPAGRLIAALAVSATTLITQRPWQQLDAAAYFQDWFPYYIHRGDSVGLDSQPPLWPVWGWRLLMTAGLGWMLAASLPNRTTRG